MKLYLEYLNPPTASGSIIKDGSIRYEISFNVIVPILFKL